MLDRMFSTEANFSDLTNVNLKITTRYDSYYKYDVTTVLQRGVVGDNPIAFNTYRLGSGYAVEIFRELQFLLNFTYIINSAVNTYGFYNSSANDVDLYMASYSLYTDRLAVADPTFVTGLSKVVGFVNHDFDQFSNDLFRSTVTGSELEAFGVMLLLFLVTALLCAKFEAVSNPTSLFHLVAVILHQGEHTYFAKVSTKLALLVVAWSMLLVVASYTGTIASRKAVADEGFSTVEALLKSSYSVLMEVGKNSSTIRLMLEKMSNQQDVSEFLSIIKKSHRQTPYNTYTSVAEYIWALHKTPGTAYVIDEETGLDPMGSMPCAWSKIPIFNVQYPWSMFLKKGSPYRPALNYGILRLHETGIIDRIKKKCLPSSSTCPAKGRSFTSIHLSQLYSAFASLAAVAIGALGIWIVEKRVKVKKQDKHKPFNYLS